MKLLVLGGTQFVGRHIVEALVHAGHSVSVFNRGQTVDELPANVERLRGDRDLGRSGIGALADRTWDACVDVSGLTATHVRPSAELLRRRVGRYIYISAVSVYGDPPHGPVDEAHPRSLPAGEDVTEVVGDMYGRLKVTCENIVEEVYGDRCALLRPQIIAGPHDPYDRYSYWVRRATQAGEMLAPGDGSDFVQVIDACDVAQFARRVCEKSLSGSFNLAGPRLTWAEFLNVLSARNLVWVPADVISAAGVTEFDLPLYRPPGAARSSLMHVSNERAIQAGLTLTDPLVTANEVRSWLQTNDLSLSMSREREAELISIFRSKAL
jgi:2'-hydroxyisoflavone reductase